MSSVKIFRILTYILLPIGFLFGLMCFLVLIPAIVNPAMWLMLFLFASIVIYTFSSFKFLTAGIDRNARCKPSLKDWIKVNAYVSMATGAMFLINAIGILTLGPVAMNDFVSQMIESQPNLQDGIKPEFFIGLLKTVAGFILITGMIIIAHVLLGFRMLKMFGHLFTPPANP